VVTIAEDTVVGGSVGDSAAWLVSHVGLLDLTESQRRKPLIGSGRAKPADFGPVPFTGRLLLATDGLLRFLPHRTIADVVLSSPLQAVPAALVACLTRTGADLPDDVAIVVAEYRLDS
jgi:hypothetical protein